VYSRGTICCISIRFAISSRHCSASNQLGCGNRNVVDLCVDRRRAAKTSICRKKIFDLLCVVKKEHKITGAVFLDKHIKMTITTLVNNKAAKERMAKVDEEWTANDTDEESVKRKSVVLNEPSKPKSRRIHKPPPPMDVDLANSFPFRADMLYDEEFFKRVFAFVRQVNANEPRSDQHLKRLKKQIRVQIRCSCTFTCYFFHCRLNWTHLRLMKALLASMRRHCSFLLRPQAACCAPSQTSRSGR